MKLIKFKDLDKIDKIFLIINSFFLWIIVILAILYRYYNNLGYYEITLFIGIINQILGYIIITTPMKKRKLRLK